MFKIHTWRAFDECVASITSRADALATMLLRHTLRIDTATIDTAGKYTGAQNAFIGIDTFAIAATTDLIVSDGLTTSLTVGNGVWRTSAHNRSNRRCIEHGASML